LGLASTVSLNVEVPKASALSELSGRKNFQRDIVGPIRRISALTARGEKYARVKQTTQFIVGAGGEKDREIVQATFGLYRNLRLERVYFSAYQRGAGDPSLPGERNAPAEANDALLREHRLYQTDFLLRKYRWNLDDILFDSDGQLSLQADPKQRWAEMHPEYFPVRLRSAGRAQLLRVPGLGPTYVGRILRTRREGILRGLRDVGLRGKNLQKALRYVVMD
jgi:predicted DNA-binding helix-hairpin-helix protein